MAKEERRSVFNADNARKNAGVNQYAESFLARIEQASKCGRHRERLLEVCLINEEQLAALYELDGKGFRVERIASHYSTDINMLVPDSFYAFW